MTQKATPKSSNASTRPITNLELVSYGIFIALFLAVMFVAQTEVGKSYLWLIGLALAAGRFSRITSKATTGPSAFSADRMRGCTSPK